MLSKLTLSIEPSVIAQAKRMAEEQGLSVSRLFSEFIRQTQQRSKRPGARSATPMLDRMIGIIELSDDDKKKTDRELIEAALLERNGL